MKKKVTPKVQRRDLPQNDKILISYWIASSTVATKVNYSLQTSYNLGIVRLGVNKDREGVKKNKIIKLRDNKQI